MPIEIHRTHRQLTWVYIHTHTHARRGLLLGKKKKKEDNNEKSTMKIRYIGKTKTKKKLVHTQLATKIDAQLMTDEVRSFDKRKKENERVLQ